MTEHAHSRAADRPDPLAAPAGPGRGDARLDAPTELAAGSDRLAVFGEGVVRSAAGFRRVASAAAAEAVVAVLDAHGARSAALSSDLGPHLEAVAAACRAAGIETTGYAEAAAGSRERLGAIAAGVTGCSAAIAATGSVVMSAAAGRAAGLVAPLHVCVVREEQVLGGLTDLFREHARLGTGSLTALQTGPSRSADIEKTLVIGAHGPCTVEVVLVTGPA
ncbi:MAG: L-lactate dehydrogenase complex protein LldG [Solirubrobacteraceae bacterium]|nr:L-lactate dehydrogenase complex protein LldG [Solirubrobacteraceae bacterium]